MENLIFLYNYKQNNLNSNDKKNNNNAKNKNFKTIIKPEKYIIKKITSPKIFITKYFKKEVLYLAFFCY